MRARILAVGVAAMLAASACSSGDVDRLATDTCGVLQIYQAGEATLTEVDAEFVRIVARAEEAGVSVDLIEAQVEVQCFDALHAYLAETSEG